MAETKKELLAEIAEIEKELISNKQARMNLAELDDLKAEAVDLRDQVLVLQDKIYEIETAEREEIQRELEKKGGSN